MIRVDEKQNEISRGPDDVGRNGEKHLPGEGPDGWVHVSGRVLDSHCVHLHRRLVAVACRHRSARANRQSEKISESLTETEPTWNCSVIRDSEQE
jgi:hypothetical protein